jgi:hypothetical protein
MNFLPFSPQTATLAPGSLVFLVLVLALGVSFVVIPNVAVHWIVPRQVLSREREAQRGRVIRRFGVFLILLVLHAIYVSFR